MTTTCLILGMHRSGTSCLARILFELGIHLGEKLSKQPESSNLGGHWEAVEVIDLNDRILAHSGGTWDRPPATVTTNAELDAAMQALVSRLGTLPLSGWKDPRTTLTFPLWRRYLGDRRLLAAFRHPHAVARSLAARGDCSFERGLELWLEYNERLLAALEGEQNVHWFPYGVSRAEYGKRLERLCADLRVEFKEELLALVNPALTHHADEPIEDPRLQKMYDELRARSKLDAVPQLPDVDGKSELELLKERCAELERQLAGVMDALRSANLAHQAVDTRTRQLTERVIRIDRSLSRLAPVGNLLERMRETKVHRWYRSWVGRSRGI